MKKWLVEIRQWRNILAGLFVVVSGCMLLPSRLSAQDHPVKPQRIVSLNLCTDQLLLELVDRSRIAAMSFLSSDPRISNISGEIGAIPLIHGGAEEVMRLGADLVLVGSFTTKATVALLKRLGHRVVIVPIATSFETIIENISLIAMSVGEEARGAYIIAAFHKGFDHLRARVGASRPLAAVIYSNSYSVPPGSLAADVLEVAGYRNLGALSGGARRSVLGVEDIIFHSPDLLVFGHSPKDYPSWTSDNLRHPVLTNFFAKKQRLEIANRLWVCGTPYTLDALELLVDARALLGDRGGVDGSIRR